MDMFKVADTSVKLQGKISEWFQVKIWLHLSSVLNPMLFEIVLDTLSDDAVKTIKDFLYAVNLVLVVDNWENAQEKYVK